MSMRFNNLRYILEANFKQEYKLLVIHKCFSEQENDIETIEYHIREIVYSSSNTIFILVKIFLKYFKNETIKKTIRHIFKDHIASDFVPIFQSELNKEKNVEQIFKTIFPIGLLKKYSLTILIKLGKYININPIKETIFKIIFDKIKNNIDAIVDLIAQQKFKTILNLTSDKYTNEIDLISNIIKELPPHQILIKYMKKYIHIFNPLIDIINNFVDKQKLSNLPIKIKLKIISTLRENVSTNNMAKSWSSTYNLYIFNKPINMVKN